MKIYVYYRDEYGYVRCEVDSDYGCMPVQFCDGYAYFTSNGEEKKVPVSALEAIQNV